ncbi:LysR family transcriptional regulator [Klebsiella michiganensis]|uniref:LysR family transcriptional regulator n=1 Tax=Klebsiella michiganensis TaxID=1134687 RepID=UPI003EE0D35A
MTKFPVQLNSLAVFTEAGRYESFRRAAENLSLTTSAVSQSVRKLEERLGVKLFIRTGNSVSLSPEGSYLLREVETGFGYMRNALNTLRNQQIPPISISSPPAIASLMMPVVQELLSLDASDLQLVSDEKPDYIAYRNFDIAVLYGPEAAGQAELVSLGPDVFMPVCTPEVADMMKKSGKNIPVPLLVNETAAVRWDHWLKMNHMEAKNKQLQFNRASHIISALLDGVGVALESLRLMSPYIERGELVCWPPGEGIAIHRELTFLYVTDDPLRRPRALRVAEMIIEQCSTNNDGLLKKNTASRTQRV